MSSLVGQSLGAYQIVELLGQGAMAVVYKAYQPDLDRYVAFKTLLPDYAESPELVESFYREAQLMARLSHPHILPLYEVGQQGGTYFMAMKYLPNCLVNRLGRPLPPQEVLKVAGQVASALDYIHREGVLHCDVKPGNLLIDADDWVYLADFGLARTIQDGQLAYSTGKVSHGICMSPRHRRHLPVDVWPAAYALKLVMGEIFTGRVPYAGTPEYISPEQGADLPLDSRTDSYALGVILFEMLTGRTPYEAETPIGVVLKHLTHPIPLARQTNPALSEAVETMLVRALAKDPAERFASAGEMVSALRQALLTFEPAPANHTPVLQV